jgi:hypothetical protein
MSRFLQILKPKEKENIARQKDAPSGKRSFPRNFMHNNEVNIS